MEILERYVAIDNKCAWPNLTLMPDGSIVATIFGEPCHGTWEGAAECWTSRDGGKSWSCISVPVANEPGTTRFNLAAGLTHRDALLVLCGGHGDRPPRSRPRDATGPLLPMAICRSEDEGKNWTRSHSEILGTCIPYGDVVRLPDGRLAVSAYVSAYDSRDNDSSNTAYVFFSDDDGHTWRDRVTVAHGFNETALLATRDGEFLAASRTYGRSEHVEVFGSSEGGRRWQCRGAVSLPKECPAHLCRLRDGAILLTYGVRLRGMLGICARLSTDDGMTWDAPRVPWSIEVRESNTDPGGVDGGYPSSVQLVDGTIVTAYYSSWIPMHHRYHMGVVRWRLA